MSATEYLPDHVTLETLREAARGCRGCPLWRDATQTVFGEGPRSARVVLVGEQPGDQEDRRGEPFIGPAGRVLDRALADAGLPRLSVYVTNAVKHFKWEQRGGRRVHKKPSDSEIEACNPWLIGELSVLRPDAVVCLGVSAARAAHGRSVRLADLRGRLEPTRLSEATLVTAHPSSLLRLRDGREREYDRLVADLRLVAEHVRSRREAER